MGPEGSPLRRLPAAVAGERSDSDAGKAPAIP